MEVSRFIEVDFFFSSLSFPSNADSFLMLFHLFPPFWSPPPLTFFSSNLLSFRHPLPPTVFTSLARRGLTAVLFFLPLPPN